jgi:hypothetical protein
MKHWIVTADTYGTVGDALHFQIDADQADVELLVSALRKAGHGNVTARVWTSRQRRTTDRLGRLRWGAGFSEVRL